MADEPLFPSLTGTPESNDSAPDSGATVNSTPSTGESSPDVPDLFGDTEGGPETASADSNMVNSVVAKSSSDGNILGPKPQTSGGMAIRSASTGLGRLALKFSVVFAVLIYGFFYTQLSDGFSLLGKNPVQTLSDFETSIQDEQTTINLYHTVMAKFELDHFSVSADSYLYKHSQYHSDYTSNNSKAELAGDLALLQVEMLDSLTRLQELLNEPLYPTALAFTADSITTLETEYRDLLKSRIAEEKQNLRGESEEEVALELDNLESALAIVNDTEFQREIKQLNLEDALDVESIESLFERATSLSTNDFSTILTIKNDRVDWQVLLTELKALTRQVDPLYASGIDSNVTYSNLSFNSTDQTISLRGLTRTGDTLNFSLISDLIDELERSGLFMNVTNRSFTKTENNESGYTASFSISLELQDGEDERDTPETLSVADVFTDEDEEERVSTEGSDDDLSKSTSASDEETAEASTESSGSEPSLGAANFVGVLEMAEAEALGAEADLGTADDSKPFFDFSFGSINLLGAYDHLYDSIDASLAPPPLRISR